MITKKILPSFLVLLFFIFPGVSVHGQKKATPQRTTFQVDTLIHLFSKNKTSQESELLLKEAIQLAQQIKYYKGEALAWFEYGDFLLNTKHEEQGAVAAYEKALPLLHLIKDNYREVFCLLQLTKINYFLRRLKSSNYWGRYALSLPKEIKSLAYKEIYLICFYLGQNYQFLQRRDSCLFYYLKAEYIRQSEQIKTGAYEYLGLCGFFLENYNFDLALLYCNKSLNYNYQRQKEDPYALTNSYLIMGDIYSQSSQDLKKAYQNYQKALSLSEQYRYNNELVYAKIGLLMCIKDSIPMEKYIQYLQQIIDTSLIYNPFDTGFLYKKLGEAYEEMKDYTLALGAYSKGIQFGGNAQQKKDEISNLAKKAALLLRMDSAQYFLHLEKRLSQFLSPNLSFESKIQCYSVLSQLKAKLGRKDAYSFLLETKALEDSLVHFKLSALKHTSNLHNKIRISILKEEVVKVKNRLNKWVLLTIVILLFCFLFFLYEKDKKHKLQAQTSILMKRISDQFVEIMTILPTQQNNKTEKMNKPQIIDQKYFNNAEANINLFFETLEDYKHEVNRKMEELASYNYIVSHDLKAPLVNASQLLQLLSVQQERSKNLNVEKFVNEFQHLLTHMKSMIDGINHYTQIDNTGLIMQQVDLNAIIDRIVTQLRFSHPGLSVKFEVGKLPLLHGDPLMLYQVFINLISNAVKFTQSVSSPLVRISNHYVGDFIAITVEDNGIGFQADRSEKIFQMFYSAHEDAQFKGTGVGLAIVKRIVKRHKGEVFVETQGEGLGAKFTVKLPY